MKNVDGATCQGMEGRDTTTPDLDGSTYALSADDLLALEALRSAVAKALDRKRRLGQYAVIWRDGKVVRLEPEDLPLIDESVHRKNDG